MACDVTLDALDMRILDALQADATLSAAAMGNRVGLSHNACWRRMKRLQDLKVIKRRVALLNPGALGLHVTVFVTVRASEHTQQWFDSFTAAVRDIPEVVELYKLGGDVDFLLKVQVESIAAYDAVYRRLIKMTRLVDVSSVFAIEEVKHTTALPLPVLEGRV